MNYQFIKNINDSYNCQLIYSNVIRAKKCSAAIVDYLATIDDESEPIKETRVDIPLNSCTSVGYTGPFGPRQTEEGPHEDLYTTINFKNLLFTISSHFSMYYLVFVSCDIYR